MKIILSIISLFLNLSVSSQNIDWIRSEYGLDNISNEGLQILLDHYKSDENLFQFRSDPSKRQPYAKIKEMFHEKFKNELSQLDLHYLSTAWDNQHERYVRETKQFAFKYKESYECQKNIVDSLKLIYEPKFKKYYSSLKNVLTEELIGHLQKIKKDLDYSIQYERNHYVGYHQRMTVDIDSSYYKYYDHALKYMQEFPNTGRDGGFLSSNYSKINFIYNLKLEQYYSIYYEFETKLIKNLYKEGCNQIIGTIPDYSEDINSEFFKKASMRNSIYYFLNKNNYETNPLDTIENRFNRIPIIESNEHIENFLALEELNKIGYFKTKTDYDEYSYLKNDKGNGKISLLSFVLTKSIEEKTEIIKTFNNQNSINYFELNDNWFIGKSELDFTLREGNSDLIYTYLIYYKDQLIYMIDFGSKFSQSEMLNLIKSILK